MSLLTIIQAVADETGAVLRPASVFGNDDPAVMKMLRMAQRVGMDLVTRGEWSALGGEVSFTATASEVQPYAVPGYVGRIRPETMWDRTNRRLLSGPLSPVEWQSLKVSDASGPARHYTLSDGALRLWPIPAGGEVVAYEYASRDFARGADGSNKSEWTADTDAGRIPEELITLGVVAFYLRAEGQPYVDQMREYEAAFDQYMRNDWPSSGIMSSGDIFGERRSRDGAPAADGGSIFGGWS